MYFLWRSVHLQHAKNNSASMRKVGSLRFTPQTPVERAVECKSLFFVVFFFLFVFFFFFFQIFSLKIYIAHETQKMQSFFTFFESSNT